MALANFKQQATQHGAEERARIMNKSILAPHLFQSYPALGIALAKTALSLSLLIFRKGIITPSS